jgi:molecular chaperone GrpE
MRRGYRVGEQVIRHAMVGVVDTVPDADNGADAGDKADAAADQAAKSEN